MIDENGENKRESVFCWSEKGTMRIRKYIVK